MAFVKTGKAGESCSKSLDEIPQDLSLKKNDNNKVKQKSITKSYELCTNNEEWWKNNVIYEVYIRSFYDSDGDGIGDLNGIKAKLDYLINLGVKTLWLTPFYPSPMVDFGYDISNFNDVDPIFGTLEDFKSLLRAMKDKDLKLIMDFVPNHTSNEHEWFKKSVRKEEPYTNYYVWKSVEKWDSDGKPIPPNNWVSVFGGSAWEYNEIRNEFYLHQFAKEQPDLNFRNDKVLQEMNNILDFWLALGVDGFRVDAAPHMLEDELFRDNPKIKEGILQTDDYSSWDHIYTTNVSGNHKIIESFRNVCDSWTDKTGKERVLLTEGYLSLKELIEYYGTKEIPLAHFSFNFELLNLNSKSTGLEVYKTVSNWFDHLPSDLWSNWQIGNHDQPRAGSRFGEDSIDILNMINLLLPGTDVTYYGEEIGMLNTEIKWEETVDPAGKNQGPLKYKDFSRDPERTPMQWTDGNNAGFTEGPTTWLPVNPNYQKTNVKTESLAEESHLKVYKDLANIRQTDAWKYGSLELGCFNDASVFAFSRLDVNKSKSGLVVVTNFSKENVKVDLTLFKNVPEMVTLLTKSVNCLSLPVKSTSVHSKSIHLDGRNGAVFEFIL